jgi:hypothetical protein
MSGYGLRVGYPVSIPKVVNIENQSFTYLENEFVTPNAPLFHIHDIPVYGASWTKVYHILGNQFDVVTSGLPTNQATMTGHPVV